jgi:tetratricopeptide (TPR) repeat protein
MGDLDQAIGNYRRAFALRPQSEVSGNLNHEYGIVLAQAGRREEARAVFERRAALPSPSERANAHRSLAQLALLEGRLHRAREHFEQATALHLAADQPGSAARDLHWLGLAEVVHGDTARARAILGRASGHAGWSSGWLWLQARIGRAMLAAGDIGGARTIHARLEAARDSTALLNEGLDPEMLAVALLSADGMGDSALTMLRSREREATNNSEVLQVTIDAHLAAGRREDAARHLRALIELEQIAYDGLLPWVTAHDRYAALAESLGDTAEASRAHARLLELWGDADPELQPVVEQARVRMRGTP